MDAGLENMIYEGAGQRADRMMESWSAVEFKTGDSGKKRSREEIKALANLS